MVTAVSVCLNMYFIIYLNDLCIALPCVYVTAASMNNLNDPPRWNIQPDPRGRGAGAGDGNQWNYALLVPMLGLAAFRKLHKEMCLYVDEVTDRQEHF